MEFSAVNRRRPSRETPLGPGAKKDGCFRRLDIQANNRDVEDVRCQAGSACNCHKHTQVDSHGVPLEKD